ncbi:tetratricopeptide repeat protein [Thalassotalea nanhaiensis]|uniref:Tetratricopeptide repeat protein n=1 Tax=Thalassotalea nanhaiensis TaxID=3065648 RepID=A0ABY9TEI4_9GAMM|nr:tetratricopeptide repeat protein [Colwelliaceae bacterium SQ345]
MSELNSDHINAMQAVNLIEKSLLGLDESAIVENMADINEFVHLFQSEIESIDDALDRAERLLNLIFVEQLFVDHPRPSWPVNTHQLNDGMAFRSMAPALKNLLLLHIIRCCGFQVDAVYVPNEVMLRIVCDEDYAIIFNCLDGTPINWHELDQRLNNDENPNEHVTLEAISDKNLIVQYLISLKNSLIREQMFSEALQCVELILALNPNDPYHRRDRGFLLQQLDCFKVAFDDYQYFVERCPKDPQAKILQMQLDMISSIDTVIH